MYLKDLTDNTVKSLTYEYQNYMTSSVSYSYGLRIGSGNLGTSGNNNYHYSDIHYFGVIPDYVTNEELITLQDSIESYKGIAENNQLDLHAILATTAQPANDTVLSGQQGVFTVGYTGTDVNVAWYKNGIFTGITTDTLRIAGNNGDSVQAVLWNREDTVSSSMAYLYVVGVPVDTNKINSFSVINSSGRMFPASGWEVRVVRGEDDTLECTTGAQNEYGISEITPSAPLATRLAPYYVVFVNGSWRIVQRHTFKKSGSSVIYNSRTSSATSTSPF